MAKLDEILQSLILPDQGDFSQDLAKHVLDMRFSPLQATQYHELAEKNQTGEMTPAERETLDAFVTANTMLIILKSKARRSLVGQPSAA
jgi:hypothetical protein